MEIIERDQWKGLKFSKPSPIIGRNWSKLKIIDFEDSSTLHNWRYMTEYNMNAVK